MPELPEVEVLVRHLRPLLRGKLIRKVAVRRARVLGRTSVWRFSQKLRGARFLNVTRRGKYLLFELLGARGGDSLLLIGHLGMTGRMYLLPAQAPLPKHAAVVLQLERERFVFEDTRYFGRLTLDRTSFERLGPEPLESESVPERFREALKRSAQPIKVKLLDQTLVAGVGNIYSSEALFLAKIWPGLPARCLSREQGRRLWQAIREVLTRAIETGAGIPLDFAGSGERNGLFYYGGESGVGEANGEQFRVYDRAGQPCSGCGTLIKRTVQAARSTFYCPSCQRRR